VSTFPEFKLRSWFTAAGLELVDFGAPGSLLLATAQRIAA
jgi:hypothetical protein